MSKRWHHVRKDGTTVDLDMAGWSFSVIYSADCVEDENIEGHAPPHIENWDETEGDEQYEYDYLEGPWTKGHHRKWTGILTLEQFEEFLNECEMESEDVETMGSIGSPGCEYWAPAISFHDDGGSPGCFRGAYVSPLIPRTEPEPDWEDVRPSIIERYKSGVPTWMSNEGRERDAPDQHP
jgi:hypothetical protein